MEIAHPHCRCRTPRSQEARTASRRARIYLDTLNCATCFAGLPTIRAGGKEICWMGDRGDSFGDKDIYCAMRR
jgi:hypothetical protein